MRILLLLLITSTVGFLLTHSNGTKEIIAQTLILPPNLRIRSASTTLPLPECGWPGTSRYSCGHFEGFPSIIIKQECDNQRQLKPLEIQLFNASNSTFPALC